jgi:hypothetical protein
VKSSAYRVRVTPDAVSVQHRVSRPSWELWVLFPLYGVALWMSAVFAIGKDMLQHREYGSFGGLVSVVLIGFIFFSWSWLKYSSGEFLHCDARLLQIGQRRVWTWWRRKTFSVSSVERLRLGSRGGRYRRMYSVLTFDAGRRCDVLENISPEDATAILHACAALGVNVILPQVWPNHDGPMKADIQERGWLVNPWRPDPAEHHTEEER